MYVTHISLFCRIYEVSILLFHCYVLHSINMCFLLIKYFGWGENQLLRRKINNYAQFSKRVCKTKHFNRIWDVSSVEHETVLSCDVDHSRIQSAYSSFSRIRLLCNHHNEIKPPIWYHVSKLGKILKFPRTRHRQLLPW